MASNKPDRRGWDSNPRYGYPYNGFRDRWRMGIALKDRMIKVQTTLVAGPRNHLYRTGHRLIQGGPFCFVSSAELDHFRDLADDLHLQSIFRRANRNSRAQEAELMKLGAVIKVIIGSEFALLPGARLDWFGCR